MKIVKEVSILKKLLLSEKKENRSVGLVPTMGALHEGHISLVNRCVAENDTCVVSVFVNPTQFNNRDDLKMYPRKPERDAELLEKAGCDIAFMPSVNEIYPEKDTRKFNFGPLEKVMEGLYRSGHFNGVAQVVSKLFMFVEPDRAYFGEKDFQQIAIIKDMVRQLNMKVRIETCPIVREPDGLARSSRNVRLSAKERKKAPLIFKYLFESRNFVGRKSVSETADYVKKSLDEDPVFQVDYYEIVDGNTLQPVENWTDSDYIVGCIAVYCGKVRLIDNVIYKVCK